MMFLVDLRELSEILLEINLNVDQSIEYAILV